MSLLTKIFAASFILFCGTIGVFYLGLETDLQTGMREKTITIIDRHGSLIREYNPSGGPSQVPLAEISPELIELFIQAEDQRFYSHFGIDLIALFRAMKQNLFQFRRVSGASTITQQVARLYGKYPRSMMGKIKVMIHALKLERERTKGEILRYYLNHLPYSYKVRGLAQAASFYFAKSHQALSLAEGATLAILTRAPTLYASPAQKERLVLLRNKLLDKIKIDPEIREISKREAWYFEEHRSRALAHHFTRHILKKNISGNVLKTTIDLGLQEEVQKIVSEKMYFLKMRGVNAASVLIMDNETGDVLSYLGNYDFFDPNGGEFDGIQLPRQPGSTMKPFTYGLAMENGLHAASVVPDVEMSFKSGAGVYRPRNYSLQFTGPRTMREALGNSLNLPALYLADRFGVENLSKFLSSFGINYEKPADYYGVGLTLGNAETRLIDLVSAYSAIAGKGVGVKPRFLMDSKVKKFQTEMSAATSEALIDILSDPHARKQSFGIRSNLDTKVKSAAKTGTSTLYRDNLVIGFTPKFTVGVWVGNMNQKEMKRVSGITGAGPIYQSVVDTTLEYFPSKPFRDSIKTKRIVICAESGKRPTEACTRTYTERFKSSDVPHENCPFHQVVEVSSCFQEYDRVKVPVRNYPEEYLSWFKDSLYNQVADYCERDFKIVQEDTDPKRLAIISPPSGSVFAIDPNIPPKFQRIPIRIKGKQGMEVTWKINGEIQNSDDSELLLKLRRGRMKIEVSQKEKNGKVNSDSIQLTVL